MTDGPVVIRRGSIAVIPAKALSTRLPGKNKRIFHGKPIVQYSIELALASRLFEEVCVATDDDEIWVLAKNMGCRIWHRPPWSTRDEVGTQQVTMNCIEAIAAEGYEYACCIYATAPLLTDADIRAGFLMVQGRFEFALGVGAAPLRDAGAFYWSKVGALLDGTPLLGPTTGLVVLPEERVCDINTEDDWTTAERLYAARQ